MRNRSPLFCGEVGIWGFHYRVLEPIIKGFFHLPNRPVFPLVSPFAVVIFLECFVDINYSVLYTMVFRILVLPSSGRVFVTINEIR
jgi:hypothetical protein